VRKGPIHIEWFKGGLTNICYNALDRWVGAVGVGNPEAALVAWRRRRWQLVGVRRGRRDALAHAPPAQLHLCTPTAT
jgi:hypothetical protein